MRLLAKNGGVVFLPENEKEIYFLETQHKAKPSVHGFYIPEILNKFFNGYIDDKKYSFYFDNFVDENGLKLFYSLDLKAITTIPNKLSDGLYKVVTDSAGTPSFGLMTRYSHREFIEVLNKPLHIELISSVEDVIELKKKFEELHTSVLKVFEAIDADSDKIRVAINTIVTTIKTIPAVNGSALNTALAVNIPNTANQKIGDYDVKNDNMIDYVDKSNEMLNDVILEVKSK